MGGQGENVVHTKTSSIHHLRENGNFFKQTVVRLEIGAANFARGRETDFFFVIEIAHQNT